MNKRIYILESRPINGTHWSIVMDRVYTTKREAQYGTASVKNLYSDITLSIRIVSFTREKVLKGKEDDNE